MIHIVILNWNGAAMMQRFLPSVVANSPETHIVVADNGSTDNSVTLLRQDFTNVELLELGQNWGFAEGYNQALSRIVWAEGDYFLLLNNDVEVSAGWLTPLLHYMDAHRDVAACQPKIRSHADPTRLEYAGAAGGFIDRLGYPYCRGRVLNSVEEDHGQYDDTVDIFWATGAALMIRCEVYHRVGGLDGRFFAHQEEIDLCWRLRSRGYGIVCVPESVVYHVGGGTLAKENPRKTFLNFRNNMLLLYKNLPQRELWWVMTLRLGLDAAASLLFVLKGEWRSAHAVWQGRRAFLRMRRDFKADRRANLAATKVDSIPERRPWSVFLSRL